MAATLQIAGTLDNLLTAFNGESNAQAKYTAFAARADEEGFFGVASLFRAAAAAEAIHAAQHAKVIRSMGGVATPFLYEIEVNSTAENLQAAIEGECYERDIMYPQFIQIAHAEGNKAAQRTFQAAITAEAEHARLYKAALADLEGRRNGKRDYWVCSVCGYTVDIHPDHHCSVCSASNERFLKIN